MYQPWPECRWVTTECRSSTSQSYLGSSSSKRQLHLPCAEPYSPADRERSREGSGRARRALPLPVQQLQRDDGLIASARPPPDCVLAHRRLVVDQCKGSRTRLAVLASRDPGPGAGAPDIARRASPVGSARRPRRVGHRTPRTDTAGRVQPSLCSVESTSMNSWPSPYLNVTRSQSTQRGSARLLVLDVHALDRPDPSGTRTPRL